MKKLHLIVSRRWFDLIAQQIKKTDYRDMSAYWHQRLWIDVHTPRHYDLIEVRNGYQRNAPCATLVYAGVRLVPANTRVAYVDGTVLMPGSSYGIDMGDLVDISNWDAPIPVEPKTFYLKDIIHQRKP